MTHGIKIGLRGDQDGYGDDRQGGEVVFRSSVSRSLCMEDDRDHPVSLLKW